MEAYGFPVYKRYFLIIAKTFPFCNRLLCRETAGLLFRRQPQITVSVPLCYTDNGSFSYRKISLYNMEYGKNENDIDKSKIPCLKCEVFILGFIYHFLFDIIIRTIKEEEHELRKKISF